MKPIALLSIVALTACVSNDPTGANARLDLEYQVGEELMNDCNLRGQRCPEWLAFKKEWEAGVSYLTTFEKSLAQHKKRKAAG